MWREFADIVTVALLGFALVMTVLSVIQVRRVARWRVWRVPTQWTQGQYEQAPGELSNEDLERQIAWFATQQHSQHSWVVSPYLLMRDLTRRHMSGEISVDQWRAEAAGLIKCYPELKALRVDEGFFEVRPSDEA